MDHNLADAIKKSKRFKGISADDEYDYDDGVEMSDAKSNRRRIRGGRIARRPRKARRIVRRSPRRSARISASQSIGI